MKCIAFVEGPSLCTNGFPQSAICRGSVCNTCGKHPDTVPACQNEDILPMWIDDSGYPKYSIQAEKIPCYSCKGTGQPECTDCNGKGYNWESVE